MAYTCNTWAVWTAATACTSGTTTTSNNDAWIVWNVDSTTTSTTRIWGEWNCTGSTATEAVSYRVTEAELSEEQIAELAERARKFEEQARIEREKREAAEKRAEELLQQLLDKEQRKQHAKEKNFYLIGSDGKRYEVDCRKRQHNVFEVNAAGKRLKEYCAVQTGQTPLADNHAAQKLLLEADAAAFKRIANVWNNPRQRQAA